MDLIDIYKSFHPKAAKSTLLISAHGTFSRLDHMLGHKVNFGKLKKTEIISSIFPGTKLEINCKNKTGKFTNVWRLNNMLPSNQWVKGEIRRHEKIT